MTHLVQVLTAEGQLVHSYPAHTRDEAHAHARLWADSRYQVRTLDRCQWFLGCDQVATAVIPHDVLGEVAACDECQQLAGAR